MAGPGPAIHDFGTAPAKSWMPGPSLGMTWRGGGQGQTVTPFGALCRLPARQDGRRLQAVALIGRTQAPSIRRHGRAWPAINDFGTAPAKSWMPGPSLGMTWRGGGQGQTVTPFGALCRLPARQDGRRVQAVALIGQTQAPSIRRHGRAWPGHPRLRDGPGKVVDARAEPGHDVERWRPGTDSHPVLPNSSMIVAAYLMPLM